MLSVGLLIWCRLKRRQRKLRSQQTANGTEAQLEAQTALRKLRKTFQRTLDSSYFIMRLLVAKEDHVDNGQPTQPIDKLNVPSSAISKGSLIGKGRFGDILEATVTGKPTNY